MRICNENESISSIKRSVRAHDKDCNKKRKRHPIHSYDNFKIAKRTQNDTAFIHSEDKDCWENGNESKINQFFDNLEIVLKLTVFFFCDTVLTWKHVHCN